MAAVDVIREGFLCPICMLDLGGVADLQDHFETDHAQDEPVLNQLKEFLGKAKRKFLKEEKDYDTRSITSRSDNSPEFGQSSSIINYDSISWEPQKIGQVIDHTSAFKKIRDAHLNHYVVETNKLIIRLTKLVNVDVFKDPLKQKEFEKSVVPWAPDSAINLCLTCGKPFNIGRRRHHCRLCGAIVCHSCLNYLPYSFAKKLINPELTYEGDGFKRASSNSSINTIGLINEPDPKLKACQECRIVLEKRQHRNEMKNTKPPISVIYDHLKSNIDEVDRHLPTFHDMTKSLRAGDTMYELHDAQVMKLKLIKMCENIDQLSKHVASLGTDTPDTPSTSSMKLQRAIRSNAVNFLQQNMIWLQSLPTEQEINEIKEEKRLEAQRRVEEERQKAIMREKKRKEDDLKKLNQKTDGITIFKDKPISNNNVHSNENKTYSGWKPSETKPLVDSESDPMLQQITIIKNYIREAKNAKKFDEMRILQQNLKELQLEYSIQQTSNHMEVKQQTSNHMEVKHNSWPSSQFPSKNLNENNKTNLTLKIDKNEDSRRPNSSVLNVDSTVISEESYPEENNPFCDNIDNGDSSNPFLENDDLDSNNPFNENNSFS